jgi:hypothetical protein
MAGRSPRPKISDGAIVFLTVALMGAPSVLGDHVNHLVGLFMFYGGVAGFVLYVGLRWGGWFFGFLATSAEGNADLDNRGGNYVGRDMHGPQTVVHGDLIIHSAQAPTNIGPSRSRMMELLESGHNFGGRDSKLKEAITYAVTGVWDDNLWDGSDGRISRANEALVKFEQLARDAKLQIWGKLHSFGVYNPIPAEYWENHTVQYLSLFKDDAVIENEGTPPPHYLDLMVSRIQFEHVWAS